MSNSWRSDPIIRRLGGLIEAELLNSMDRWLVEQLHHVYESNVNWLDSIIGGIEIAQIDLIITQGSMVNALAYRKEKQRAILIPMGLLRSLWKPIVEAAHSQSVLSEAFPFPSGEPSSNSFSVPSEHPADWKIPADRCTFMMTTYCFMLEYILLHEMAHHTRGHLDEMSNQGLAVALIDEHRERQLPITAPNTGSHRDIEFDADAHGLNLSLNALNNRFPIESSWDTNDALEQLFLLIFSQLLVAQQLDDPEKSNQSRESDEHPSALYRCINFSNLATKTLYRLVGGDWQQYCDQHDAAWSEASFLAEHLGVQQRHWFGHDIEASYLSEYLIQEEDYFLVSEALDKKEE